MAILLLLNRMRLHYNSKEGWMQYILLLKQIKMAIFIGLFYVLY
ncbi:hypothetical protein HMPREF0541_00069 [Lacticaseibacillus rhamnosus ATCC 21052]|nr:hypothetical protein HMPREF0541_00069 [Lacticaseibacillus rhamnosus ATCC 21052]